ncbi:unnamed protein product, partial [Symbiodinium microadriaticum]
MHCIDVLMKTALLPEVLLRFRAAHKQGQETKAEVVPFKLAVSLRGQASMDCFTALSTLSYCGALKLLGLRLRPERMQKSAMAAELEEAYLSVPYTDSTLDEPSAEGEGRCQLEPRPDSLPARLRNPHAVCYLNACAQAFCWVGNLLAAPRPCLGSAQAALKLLRKNGPLAAPILLDMS